MTFAPVLALYDPANELTSETDANGLVLQAVLLQWDGKDNNILAYASRTFNQLKNYSIREQKLLAVVGAVENSHAYVLAQNCKCS